MTSSKLILDGSQPFDRLILEAAQVLRPRWVGDRLIGDVACVLVTEAQRHFHGVCIDTGSGTGFCAEHAAIAAMVTAGQSRIQSIVAVWRKEESGELFVLPPCGRCREFIRQIDALNITTQVILGRDTAKALGELLPHWAWPEPLT
ncbi:hypothetical protein [Deinococcus humi]|uniref:Cytidine deaminase n=1 Tax=Deinococcus humi TaxID=662880 RepID=A0A7W8NGZ9_9DEIO|nr:cytidine deaminase [Deinococcus humi]